PTEHIISDFSLTLCQGQATVTQPGSVSSALGGSVTIRCQTSHRVDDGEDQFWFQQKDGEPPKRLSSYGNRKVSGIPDRFSASGSNTDFTLTISGVQAEDAAVYYCLGEFKINSQYSFTQLNRELHFTEHTHTRICTHTQTHIYTLVCLFSVYPLNPSLTLVLC
uniref:Ig-like domain-containing protein n=1 Tax=Acanthochromis polyacanthus TaxID=80966 RepID=A0A3Q1FPX1_9TELE